ncbi:MAG: bestrophin family protein [Polyangiaceae bacterium]
MEPCGRIWIVYGWAAKMVDYEPKRFLELLFNFKGSVAKGISGRVLVTMLVAVAAALLNQRTGFKLPPIAHTLVGAALALLLVFRTNASYDRFWEGRRLVGAIGNRLRDLARQFASLVPEAADGRDALARHLVLFFKLSVQALRSERELDALGDDITADERAALEGVSQRPYVVLSWVSARVQDLVAAGTLSGERQLLIDQNLTALTDALGGCERIRNTPVPIAYAHHIKMFLTLFCLSVPFAMVNDMHWYTPIAAGILAFALYGIDEIGVEIEDPFGYDPNDLPLDNIGKSIARSVGDIMKQGRALGGPPSAP